MKLLETCYRRWNSFSEMVRYTEVTFLGPRPSPRKKKLCILVSGIRLGWWFCRPDFVSTIDWFRLRRAPRDVIRQIDPLQTKPSTKSWWSRDHLTFAAKQAGRQKIYVTLCDFRNLVCIKWKMWSIFSQGFFREFARIRGSLGDKPTTIQNFCRHRTALKVGDNCNDFESFDFGVKLLWTWLIH